MGIYLFIHWKNGISFHYLLEEQDLFIYLYNGILSIDLIKE